MYWSVGSDIDLADNGALTCILLLKLCPDLIAGSLCAIFNRSINTGIFPTDWKCSKVISLFKKGERRDLNNYQLLLMRF